MEMDVDENEPMSKQTAASDAPLVVCKDIATTKKQDGDNTMQHTCEISPELKTILIISFILLVEFSAYGPVESIQSSLNSESGLGTLSLACLYLPYFVFAIAAPLVVRLLTPKWTILSAWLCDVIYVSANFYPSWATLVPASILDGMITGPMWTAKDLYVSHLARQSVQRSSDSSDKAYQSTLSFFNGVVLGGLSFSGVMGQVISSAVFGITENPNSTFIDNCGAWNCPDTLYSNSTSGRTKPAKTTVYTLLGILLGLVLLSILVTAIFLKPVSSGNHEFSLKRTFFSCAHRLRDYRMLLLVPQILLIGFLQGVIVSDYTRSYVTCGVGIGYIGYTMICRGVFESLSCVVFGWLAKFTGRQLLIIMSLASYTVLLALLWFWTPTSTGSVAMYFIVPGLFGFCNAILSTEVCSLLAILFENDRAAAFANYYTFRSIIKAISFALSGFVCVWQKLIVSSALLVIACVTYGVLEILLKTKPTLEERLSPGEDEKQSIEMEDMLKSKDNGTIS